MANIFKIGQTVTYSHYGVSQSAKITRMSESGEVLFLDNGGWKHAISCKPEAAVKVKNTILVDSKRKVCRVFDTGADGPCDRYTIAFKGYRVEGYGMVYPYLASNDYPFSPGGFGQHCESKHFLTGGHLGKRVSFDSLPADVQKFILGDI